MKSWHPLIALLAVPVAAQATPIGDFVSSMERGLTPDHAAVAGVFGKTVDQLRDPRSLQVVDLFTKTENDSATGCMQYRSRNGFGGYNSGHAVWVLKVKNGKGSLTFGANDAKAWNKACVGGGFVDRTALGEALIKTIK